MAETMGKAKIEFISRSELARLLQMTRSGVSAAVMKTKKLRDVSTNGKTGIDIHDPKTISYVIEVCTKKAIPIPAQFKKEKSDVQLFMDAVDVAYDSYMCEDCRDLKTEFRAAVVEYVKREKG